MTNQELFEDLKQLMRVEIGRVEQKVDGLEQRFDGLEQRFDGLEQKVDKLDKKIDAVEERLTQRMDEGFAAAAAATGDLIDRVDALEAAA